eukprot:jgi/Botrbrau1/6242/Bobra.0109s0036.1
MVRVHTTIFYSGCSFRKTVCVSVPVKPTVICFVDIVRSSSWFLHQHVQGHFQLVKLFLELL